MRSRSNLLGARFADILRRAPARLCVFGGAFALAACSPAPPASEPHPSAPPTVRGATEAPLSSEMQAAAAEGGDGGVDASVEPPLPAEPGPRIAAIQARLLMVADFTGTEVPDRARPMLADLKRASRDFLSAELARLDLAHAPVEDVDREVGDAARSAGIRYGAEGSSDARPGTWSASITTSLKNPRYLVGGYYFAIPCGNDGGYLVYDLRASGGPKLLLAVGSPDYESIAGAFWQLAFAMPPPGSPDAFFFTAVRVEPWCTSALRHLQLLVLRPGPTPEAPAVLVDETVPFHLKGTHGVDVGANQVTLTFTPDDPSKLVRRRWSIGKVGAKKLGP